VDQLQMEHLAHKDFVVPQLYVSSKSIVQKSDKVFDNIETENKNS